MPIKTLGPAGLKLGSVGRQETGLFYFRPCQEMYVHVNMYQQGLMYVLLQPIYNTIPSILYILTAFNV